MGLQDSQNELVHCRIIHCQSGLKEHFTALSNLLLFKWCTLTEYHPLWNNKATCKMPPPKMAICQTCFRQKNPKDRLLIRILQLTYVTFNPSRHIREVDSVILLQYLLNSTNLLVSLFRTISSAALILGPCVSKLMPNVNNVVFFSNELTIFCSTWLPIIAH